ncbi:hypothetical protein [Pinisolibacter aquiterrae]|uniref:hypothetical protein n=1 Tax=Pinisolibacter aquiterrae TaxID=2815579 RepID=UPI001C3E6261|nr:hypothetical protein [Pinisolibacter aquiterrae]MBV5266077.1 hypothetical protein [Pinisolibacter aquiterrae]MCC8233630.1 hypothetical protein [Pinisolibacter aquiterrae]
MKKLKKKRGHLPKFIETLVYVDEPQVVLLSFDEELFVIGVAIEFEGFNYPFYGVGLKVLDLKPYFDCKVDLRYIFDRAAKSRRYVFDIGPYRHGDIVQLFSAPTEIVESDEYYPEHGFFARDHHSKFALNERVVGEKHTFHIDGSWAASDFSKFYGRLSDLYAFYASLISIDQAGDDQRISAIAKLKGFVTSKFWQGGGSYVGFFSDLADAVWVNSPLRVSRIQYASPGVIEVEGQGRAIDEIVSASDNFSENGAEIRRVHAVLNKLYSNERLKAAPANSNFSSDAMKDLAKKYSDSLLREMGVGHEDAIFEACGRNIVVYGKVTMALFRRVKALEEFEAQGRARLS